MKAWVAKDKKGIIFLCNKKPEKGYEVWFTDGVFIPIEVKDLPQGVNPNWEDEEPIEVELKIEKL